MPAVGATVAMSLSMLPDGVDDATLYPVMSELTLLSG